VSTGVVMYHVHYIVQMISLIVNDLFPLRDGSSELSCRLSFEIVTVYSVVQDLLS